MEGNAYFYDFKNDLFSELSQTMDKYGLELVEYRQGAEAILTNEHIKIKIFVSDIQFYSLSFFECNDEENYEYNIHEFKDFIFNAEHKVNVSEYHGLKDFPEYVRQVMRDFNRDISTYLKMPMEGDFSWKNKFKTQKELIDKYKDFANKTQYSHSEERQEVAKMVRRGLLGWKEKVELYFQKYPNGEEE